MAERIRQRDGEEDAAFIARVVGSPKERTDRGLEPVRRLNGESNRQFESRVVAEHHRMSEVARKRRQRAREAKRSEPDAGRPSAALKQLMELFIGRYGHLRNCNGTAYIGGKFVDLRDEYQAWCAAHGQELVSRDTAPPQRDMSRDERSMSRDQTAEKHGDFAMSRLPSRDGGGVGGRESGSGFSPDFLKKNTGESLRNPDRSGPDPDPDRAREVTARHEVTAPGTAETKAPEARAWTLVVITEADPTARDLGRRGNVCINWTNEPARTMFMARAGPRRADLLLAIPDVTAEEFRLFKLKFLGVGKGRDRDPYGTSSHSYFAEPAILDYCAARVAQEGGLKLPGEPPPPLAAPPVAEPLIEPLPPDEPEEAQEEAPTPTTLEEALVCLVELQATVRELQARLDPVENRLLVVEAELTVSEDPEWDEAEAEPDGLVEAVAPPAEPPVDHGTVTVTPATPQRDLSRERQDAVYRPLPLTAASPGLDLAVAAWGLKAVEHGIWTEDEARSFTLRLHDVGGLDALYGLAFETCGQTVDGALSLLMTWFDAYALDAPPHGYPKSLDDFFHRARDQGYYRLRCADRMWTEDHVRRQWNALLIAPASSVLSSSAA